MSSPVTGMLVGLLAVALPVRLLAQGAEPLRKTDLIRLLSNPVIHQSEVADLIRRNCITFRPTERDRADLRTLGADTTLLNRIDDCAKRPAPKVRPASAAPLLARAPPSTPSRSPPSPPSPPLPRPSPSGPPPRVAAPSLGADTGSTTAVSIPAVAVSIPAVEIEFLESAAARGAVRTRLADALTLQVRSGSGRPVSGKAVVFQAVNAEVDPNRAVTDSAGRVEVQVTLGRKAGNAIVTATVDSVETRATLQVEPGAAVELLLERDGTRVNGGRILVELGVPFALTLKARDAFGNVVSMASLTARLEELRRAHNSPPRRLLDFLAVQPEGATSVLTFKPVRLGSADLRIEVGLTAVVGVLVVPPRAP